MEWKRSCWRKYGRWKGKRNERTTHHLGREIERRELALNVKECKQEYVAQLESISERSECSHDFYGGRGWGKRKSRCQ